MQCQSFSLRVDNTGDLERLNAFLAQVMPLQVTSSLVQGSPAFWSVLVFYEGEAKPAKPAIAEKKPKETTEFAGSPVFEALRKWRSQKARDENVPPYVIAHNAELEEIARLVPKTLEELENIKGFGKAKREKYGQEILKVLRSS